MCYTCPNCRSFLVIFGATYLGRQEMAETCWENIGALFGRNFGTQKLNFAPTSFCESAAVCTLVGGAQEINITFKEACFEDMSGA